MQPTDDPGMCATPGSPADAVFLKPGGIDSPEIRSPKNMARGELGKDIGRRGTLIRSASAVDESPAVESGAIRSML
jgi:hypothetical protein